MKTRHFLCAAGLGFGLTVILLLTVNHPVPTAQAHPGIYYVSEGGTGDCLSVTTPCSSVVYAISLTTAPGDEVRVATGTYTENLVITRSLSLRGGWNVPFTTRNPAIYTTTIDGSGEHVISATIGSGFALIEGFTIWNGRDGVHLYSGVLTLTSNIVYSMTKQGVEVTTGAVWIANNTIFDTDEEGISINGGTAVISANLVHDTGLDIGLDGIHTDGDCTSVEIRGNNVYNTGSDGIDGRGQTVVIASNTVSNTGKYGIYARDGASTILNNTVYDTSDEGIRTHGSSTDVEIRSNTVYSTGNDGIDARGTNVVVTSNTICDADKDGIHAEGADTVHVQRNTVHDVDDDGIESDGVSHSFINANLIYEAGNTGIQLDNAGTFTVTNNIVADSGTASILVKTGASPCNVLYHNTLIGSAAGQQGTGISVTVPGITVILANNIVVSHTVGITKTAGATLVVSNTLLWANGSDPISGTSAITQAPLFVAPASHNYHILPNSPGIDAGTDVGVLADVDGDPRLGAPDVGADEIVQKVYLPLVMRDY